MNKQTIEEFIDAWSQSILLWQRLRRPLLALKKLTNTDKRILFGIAKHGKLTKKDLAKIMVLEHSSLTRSLDRLEERGLLVRHSDPSDRRFVSLSLTASGKKMAQSLRQQSLDLAESLLSNISTKNLRQAIDVMNEFQLALIEKLEEN